MLRDLISNLSVKSLLIPAVRTADANSSSVDLKQFGSLEMAAHLGQSGDTLSGSVKVELELEHSDDNSAWSDCADTDLSSSVTGTNTGTFAVIDDAAEDEAVYVVGYKGSKRYVRVVLNFTGTHTNGIPCSVIGLKGNAQALPTS